MDVYFDIKNLNSFISTSQTDIERYYDCYRMLKKYFKVHVNMELSELHKNPLIVAWLNTFTQGGSEDNDQSKGIDFSNIEEKGGYANLLLQKGFDTQSAVYLLEEDSSHGGSYLYGTVGEELDILSSLFMEDNQYDKEIKVKDIIHSNWGVLKDYTKPCTDIIIIDYYWFYYGNINFRDEMYEKNCYELINVLTDKLNPMDHVNIVIFTSPMVNNDDYIDTDFIRDNIKAILDRKYIHCSVSFVLFENEKKPEHDRNIFSNYTRIEPGSSLSFFRSDGRSNTHGRNFDIKSLARNNFSEGVKELARDLQEYVTNINAGILDGYINVDSSRPLCNYLRLIKPIEGHFYEGEIFCLKEISQNEYYIKCDELDDFFIIRKCISKLITDGKVFFTLVQENNKEWIVNSIVRKDL